MYVDSHCHLDFPQLAENLDEILLQMKQNRVGCALVVSVDLDDWPGLMKLVQPHPQLYASVGVHPDYEKITEPSVEDLLSRTQDEKVIAIGETGLDYFRKPEPLDWQRERFRVHIRASKASNLPLIIHTRNASADTIRIMQEERAEQGVMHCFTESWEVAQAALDLNFYISFSGIVTFKSAQDLQEVAKKVPLDRLLIETDSPFLAPVPYRGKLNQPSYVVHVAEKIAELRGMTAQQVADVSTRNFFNLFNKIKNKSDLML
ncbi:TatD family hydrolase [Alcaligenes endophyticus]|uniref:TatD family hydrolase n=1 Tax=Alcaligenes endophyticus TaxID=1929088 RepID=A0ABT8EJE0_9BURK|nr:TatD family hydrolase [Alcaligenes endophyticus]MCX5591729.1 TatD family hydrolase [Alcaligenes endophyticus]MDN4121406.1 TatD family hydrolase [Alcaligenes endophyticus]